jgi:hypothetical protein
LGTQGDDPHRAHPHLNEIGADFSHGWSLWNPRMNINYAH